MAGRPVTDTTLALEGGGLVQVANVGHQISLRVVSAHGPGVPPVVMTRGEAESAVEALTASLAHLRGEDARPAKAEPLEAAVKRKAKA